MEFFRQPDINQGVYEFLRSQGAVLLDVRTPYEYREGHSPAALIFRCRSWRAPRNFWKIKKRPCMSTADPAHAAARQCGSCRIWALRM